MRLDARRLLLPLVHRFRPTLGPGGFVDSVLSKALEANAENTIHVTRHFDVLEILERDEDFSVRTYDERMTATTGPFLLGMNDKARYDRDAAVIRRGIRKTDYELTRMIAGEETRAALDRVRGFGRIDVVKDLVEPVTIRTVARLFGTAVPDLTALLRLYQTTSKYQFAFWFDPVMRDEAVDAARTIRELLTGIVADRRRSGDTNDDVIGRFIQMPDGFYDGDAGIVRSVAGLSSGAINAPVGLCVYSIDTLLSLPDPELSVIRSLATLALRGSDDAAERFRDYLYEAERFNVYPPYSYRYAEHDTRIATGTRRERSIPKGSTVVTWQSLGAFDSDIFDEPFEFVPGRPRWQYAGFGHARHRCTGEHIGQAMLYEMAVGVLALPGIRRAPSRAGRVQNRSIQEGKYPFTFTADFVKSS